ncbi:MAG: 50S ribosomal protein L20 [Candidatus Berkelbacteria bacterium]|nr:50S ribosomal protein L20 [Candidatus Berkelbacteria bacterium]
MRVTSGTARHANHKRIIKLAKGYQGRRKSVYKLAKQAVIKAGRYSYRDRRVKKRDFRALWILRINAALKPNELSYSKFIALLKTNQIDLNRKMLSEMIMENPSAFQAIVDKVK